MMLINSNANLNISTSLILPPQSTTNTLNNASILKSTNQYINSSAITFSNEMMEDCNNNNIAMQPSNQPHNKYVLSIKHHKNRHLLPFFIYRFYSIFLSFIAETFRNTCFNELIFLKLRRPGYRSGFEDVSRRWTIEPTVVYVIESTTI